MNTSNSCKHQHNSKYIIIYHRRDSGTILKLFHWNKYHIWPF